MAGKDGRTHPNVEMRPDSECVRVRMHGVPEGDGRWWWALNGCTNQPEGWPLGPVMGQTAPGAGMAGMDGWDQMQHDLAAHAHLHLQPDRAAFGPTHPNAARSGW